MAMCCVAIRVARFAGCRRAAAWGSCRCKTPRPAGDDAEPDVEKVGLMEERYEGPPPQYRDDEESSK